MNNLYYGVFIYDEGIIETPEALEQLFNDDKLRFGRMEPAECVINGIYFHDYAITTQSQNLIYIYFNIELKLPLPLPTEILEHISEQFRNKYQRFQRRSLGVSNVIEILLGN